MALITCPECDKEISDTVKDCPHCGYRLKKMKQKKERKPIPKWIIAVGISVISLFVIVGILIYAVQLSDEEQKQVDLINTKIAKRISYDISTDSLSKLSGYMKEYDSVSAEYDELTWKQKFRVADYKKIDEKKEETQNRIQEIEKSQVDAVIKSIDDIGEVSLYKEKSILVAEDKYNALTKELKKRVTNADQIEKAKDRYYTLSVDDTISKINSIGKVTLSDNGYSKINDARNAYDDLPVAYREKVSNYSNLLTKEKEYDKLNVKRIRLEDARSELKRGNLNKANKLLKKLPNSFSYNGTKASVLKKRLKKNRKWMSLCGRWETTGGQMRVTQTSKDYGDSTWWYHDFKKGDYSISIRCSINDDGTVKVLIDGGVPVYTSYSTISEGVDDDIKSIVTSKKMSGMGTVRINNYTTLTLSKSGITVSYKKVTTNEDVYFNYTYSTKMILHKKTAKY